jgi:integrase
MNELVPKQAARTVASAAASIAVPAVIAGAGDHAARRFLEFFAATIRNKNTRMAYYRAACHFFAWVEQHRIGELADIEPIHVGTYIEALQATAAKPTVKLHLAAIRMLFDWLVVGQILAVNPAHAVRGPKHVVRRGKTPVLTEEQARRLLESLDASTLVGLRDRALIGVMTYAFARIGAVVAMKVEDYYPAGKRWWVRLPKLLLAMQEDPSAPAPYRILAACYAHMGKLDEAGAVVKRLRAIDPDPVPSFRSLTWSTGSCCCRACGWRRARRYEPNPPPRRNPVCRRSWLLTASPPGRRR